MIEAYSVQHPSCKCVYFIAYSTSEVITLQTDSFFFFWHCCHPLQQYVPKHYKGANKNCIHFTDELPHSKPQTTSNSLTAGKFDDQFYWSALHSWLSGSCGASQQKRTGLLCVPWHNCDSLMILIGFFTQGNNMTGCQHIQHTPFGLATICAQRRPRLTEPQ